MVDNIGLDRNLDNHTNRNAIGTTPHSGSENRRLLGNGFSPLLSILHQFSEQSCLTHFGTGGTFEVLTLSVYIKSVYRSSPISEELIGQSSSSLWVGKDTVFRRNLYSAPRQTAPKGYG
jgi:hypothetical protein